MAPYTVCPIPDDKVDQAYPIARLAHAGLALEDWRRMCRQDHGDGTSFRRTYRQDAILVAIDQRGFVRGMCALRIVGGGDANRLLDAPIFAISAGLDIARVVAAMLRGLVGQCRQRQCAGLTIAIPSDDLRMKRAIEEARKDVPLLARGLVIDIVSQVQPAVA